MQVDVAIIGGGIAGAGAAYALQRRNISTVIIDDGTGRAASGNPAGLIMPWLSVGGGPPRDFHDAAWHYTQQILAVLDLPFLYQGVIQLPPDDHEKKRFARLAAQQVFDETDMQFCDAGKLSALAQTEITIAGFYFSRAAAISPALFCEKLSNGSQRITAPIHTIRRQDNMWHLSDKAGAAICTAQKVILATGYRDDLLQQYLPEVLRPRRGQLTFVPQQHLPELARPIVCGNYITPGIGGQCILGATYKHSVDDAVTVGEHAENLTALQQFEQAPALATAAKKITPDMCEGRAAVRATTMNHLPIVGPLPGQDDLYVITGLGSRGLLTAPLLGEILAAQLTRSVLPVAQQAYAQLSPARFTRAG